MIKGGNLAYENPALTDNWDDAEGYYSKYIMTLTLYHDLLIVVDFTAMMKVST